MDTFSKRIQRAHWIADSLRHDEKLHRLAMDTVFALEDCYETMLRLKYGSICAELDAFIDFAGPGLPNSN